MRNYVQFFWAKITYDVDVNPPNPVITLKTFCMDVSQVALDTFVQETIAGLETDARVQNVRTQNNGPLYFLMDKTNLALMLASAGNTAMQLIDQGTYPSFVYNPSDPKKPTPRKGWTDIDGVKRPPPPSERGTGQVQIVGKTGKAGTIILPTDALQQLQTILALLQQQLRSVTGEIGADIALAAALIADLIKQLFDKKITAQKALDKAKIIMDNLFQQIGGS